MPNIFGFPTRAEREAQREWEQEFDRRLADSRYRKDKMSNFNLTRPSEVRVEDDEGTMRRRNGEGCCGCGKWDSSTYSPFAVWNRRKSGHHDHDDRG